MNRDKPCTIGRKRAKLTEEQVRSILKSDPKIPAFMIAMEYSISEGTILRIRQRKTWKHVNI